MAAAAKTKGDKAGQRMAQDRIRIIQQGECASTRTRRDETISSHSLLTHTEQMCFLFLEMKQLESHPMFNPAIKVADVPQKEKKTLPVSEDKEELSFSLFEQAEKDRPAEKGSNKHDLSHVTFIHHTVNIKHNLL